MPNKTLFLEHLSREIDRCQEFEEYQDLFAVLLLSIDRFRNIKHSLGYMTSKDLLIAVARRLSEYAVDASFDTVARINDDEFAVLISGIEHAENVLNQAELLYRQLIKPFNINGTTICSTVSIGVAFNQDGNREPEKLLQWADTAMQEAKTNFVTTSVLFDNQMQSQALERLRLENDLQQAIDNRRLYLNYQPIVSLKTGEIECLEALVRWKHDSLGTIAPDKFIPICEETGQIIALGQWVLTEACCQLVGWRSTVDFPLTVSINLSRIQIYHPELILQIDRLLESLNLTGKDLKLEITESTLMENTSAVTKVLEQLRQRDIRLCLDDFGTGYSSLSYLRYLPVDTVKIDRSFIGTKINSKDYDIVKAIIDLAHSLGLNVVAEGIETQEQLKILKSLGCEYGQGYLFAYPLQSEDVIKIVRR